MSIVLKHKWSIEARLRVKKLRNSTEYIASRSGPNNPNWKGGIAKTTKVSYDTTKERFPPYTEIRRDPLNYYILQTKCMQCNKWFSPNKRLTNRKLSGIKPLKFFCSVKCSNENYNNTHISNNKLIIKTTLWRDLVKHNRKLRILNKRLSLNHKREVNKLKNVLLSSYNKKYGKLATKRKNKKQLIQKFKRQHPNKYNIYKYSKTGLWFELKRWQNPTEWRSTRLLVFSRSRAKKAGLEFNLDKEWCKKRMLACKATGIKFDNSYDGTLILINPYAPSIDRINNTKGYTKNNCRLTLTIFNSLKSTLTDLELYKNLKEFVKYYEENHYL